MGSTMRAWPAVGGVGMRGHQRRTGRPLDRLRGSDRHAAIETVSRYVNGDGPLVWRKAWLLELAVVERLRSRHGWFTGRR